jgi:uncharacterized protein (TIGR00255 family)
MTGYAFEERQEAELSLSVEIRGFNSRFLEVFVYLPAYLSSLEARIREYIASRCRRGKVEATIRLREPNRRITVSVNLEAAKAYEKALSLLARTLHHDEKPGLSVLLGMEGVLEVERDRDDDERYWKDLGPLLESALNRFEAERIREGKHTEEDILSHTAVLESAVEEIASHGPALETSIKENLRGRFAELLGDRYDENRVLAETAVLLMKYTISEELSRLRSHLAELRAETGRNASPGKKLDFLCQEINREINTIGSKTPILEVSRAVVVMKDALENIREQLRNVE